MKVLLACSAGMSTSLLEVNMKKYLAECKLDVEVFASPTNEARGMISKFDVVLLGPQVGYELPAFKKLANGVPCAVIPPQIYAMSKGKETVELAISLAKKA